MPPPSLKRKVIDTVAAATVAESAAASKRSKIDNKAILADGANTNTKMPDSLSGWDRVDSKNNILISSWNVAGLNAALKKNFSRYVEAEKADILCLQETRLNDPLHSAVRPSMYPHRYFAICKESAGYSGTAVFSKIKPKEVTMGFPKGLTDVNDNEGRLITLDFDGVSLITCYTPNAGADLKRLDYRMQWDAAIRKYLKAKNEVVPTLLLGDLNVAHKEIDLARPKTNLRTAGFTIEERDSFSKTLEECNLIDVWRANHPEAQGSSDGYTYFSYRFQCRAKGLGWRLDYFLAPEKLREKIAACEIRSQVYGASDHVPLVLEIDGSLFESSATQTTSQGKESEK